MRLSVKRLTETIIRERRAVLTPSLAFDFEQ